MYYNKAIRHIREITPEEFKSEIMDGSFAEKVMAMPSENLFLDKISKLFKK